MTMTDWNQIWPAHNRSDRAVQLGYLDGYCLALEDFLRATVVNVNISETVLPGFQAARDERKRLRKIASKQLDEARKALKRIKEMTYINEDVPSDLHDRKGTEDQDDQGRPIQDQEI